MKRIYEQEEIYNAIMAVIDEQDRTIAEKDKAIAEKDKAIAEMDKAIAEMDKAINRIDEAIEKKDNENRKLREMLMAAGMSPEAIELRLST